MSLRSDEITKKYELLEKLGEGGMGAVYKVRHRLLGVDRVIKVIRPQLGADDKMQLRFQREARTATQLVHPNLAQVFDFSVDAMGTASIVMEYVDGRTLLDILQQDGRLPVPLAAEIAVQGLHALGFLHQRGFVHRDISADNLMLTTGAAGRPLVKLIDFGLAKNLEGGGLDLTATGLFVGKVRYAAPEQFQNGRSVDARADLYSFGVLLYQLLTGCYPIVGESISELVAGHLLKPPLDFAHSDPGGDVPAPLRALVNTALAKEPEQRIPSAEAFARALEPFRESRSAGDDLASQSSTALLSSTPGTLQSGTPTTERADPDGPAENRRTPRPRATSSLRTIELERDVDARRRWRRLTRNAVWSGALALVAGVLWLVMVPGSRVEPPASETATDHRPFESEHRTPPKEPAQPQREPAREDPEPAPIPAPAKRAEPVLEVRKSIEQKPAPQPRVQATPAGTLIIDAVPWGEVLAIEDETGVSRLASLTSHFTPLSVELPAGRYVVELGDGGSRRVRIDVQVRPGQSSDCRGHFGAVTADSFFEELGW